MTWWLDSSDFVLVSGALFAGSTACLVAFCSNMRRSRCTKVSCCCISCDREIESDELVQAELAMEAQNKPRPRSNSNDTMV